MKPKQTSLIYVLNKEIREKGYISYERMCQICEERGNRPTNGERRLRPSESPTVEEVKGKRGAVIGYRYKPEISEVIGDFINDVAKMAEKAGKKKEEKMLFPSYFKQKSEIIQDQDWTQI